MILVSCHAFVALVVTGSFIGPTQRVLEYKQVPGEKSLGIFKSSASGGLNETFALAMHVFVDSGDLVLLSRFFSAVYHPDNVYLVEVEKSELLEPARSMVTHAANNVYLRVADPSVPDGISEVLNLLSAMSFFVDREDVLGIKFHYFINTRLQEYPVLTPSNMRTVMRAIHSYDSPPVNFMAFSDESEWEKFSSRYDRLYYDPSIVFTKNQTAMQRLISTMFLHPDRGSRKYKLARADPQMVLSSTFVRFACDALLSKRLLMLLADSKKPIEHFFATLASEAKNTVGKWVKSTALRCPDIAVSIQSASSSRDIVARVQGISDPFSGSNNSFKGQTIVPSQPCLFAGPEIRASDNEFDVRDAIDEKILSGQGDVSASSASQFVRTVHQLLVRDVVNMLRKEEDSQWAELEKLRPIPL